MRQNNPNKRDHCREVATHYIIDRVPGACWLGVAVALWQECDYAPLEIVNKVYLKGKTCVQLHWLPWQLGVMSYL